MPAFAGSSTGAGLGIATVAPAQSLSGAVWSAFGPDGTSRPDRVGAGRTRAFISESSKYRAFFARIGWQPETSTSSSSWGSCITSPGVSSGRAVSCRDTIRCPSQGLSRWPAHRPHFGGCAKGVRDTFGRALVVGREAHAHMAVVEDRVVQAVGFLDLVQRLGDQEALQAITRHEGERAFEEVEPAERRKFVEHEE